MAGNTVALAHGDDSVTAGGVLAGLEQGDGLNTTVGLADTSKAVVSAVTVTGPGGTTTTKSPYAITMPEGDIVVTVVLSKYDKDDPEVLPTYVATLVQSGGTADPGNALTGMSNLTEPTMAGGGFWTAGHEDNTLRGTFTTAEGWYAKVSAVGEDGVPVPVLQQDTAGACTVGLTMPAKNVTVTVAYTQEKPDSSHKLTLNITGHDAQAGNNATLTTADGKTAYVEGAKVGDTCPIPTSPRWWMWRWAWAWTWTCPPTGRTAIRSKRSTSWPTGSRPCWIPTSTAPTPRSSSSCPTPTPW